MWGIKGKRDVHENPPNLFKRGRTKKKLNVFLFALSLREIEMNKKLFFLPLVADQDGIRCTRCY